MTWEEIQIVFTKTTWFLISTPSAEVQLYTFLLCLKRNIKKLEVCFLDTQVSLAPTHVRRLVRWSVGHTFGFPISGRPSVQQSSLRTPQQCFWGPHHPQGGRHHHQGGQHPHQEGQHPHQGGRHHHQAFFKIVDKNFSSTIDVWGQICLLLCNCR